MSRRLLYIVNPISGRRRKGGVAELITEKTEAAGLPFRIVDSEASGDYSHLRTLIREEGITDVVIAGGDGTVNGVVGSLRSEEVAFGILPCGSGNGLAFTARIPRDHAKALDVIFRGNTIQADAFTINGAFACMLVGLGFDAQVAHAFAKDPRRGLMTYIRKTVRHFFTAPAYPFVLQLEGRRLQLDAFFISIANSNQFGNNFTIAPRASLTDGLLDVVIMTRQNKVSVLLQAARQVGGLNKLQSVEVISERSGVLYFQADRLQIGNAAGAPMHLDGDPAATGTDLHINVVKACYRLLCP